MHSHSSDIAYLNISSAFIIGVFTIGPKTRKQLVNDFPKQNTFVCKHPDTNRKQSCFGGILMRPPEVVAKLKQNRKQKYFENPKQRFWRFVYGPFTILFASCLRVVWAIVNTPIMLKNLTIISVDTTRHRFNVFRFALPDLMSICERS